MAYLDQLLRKLNERTATIGIVGLGYVGLPLAVAFAEEGFNVIGYEVSQAKADAINAGKSYVGDIPSAQLAKVVHSGKFKATTDASLLSAANAISICVPTPLTKHKDPDMTYVLSASDTVAAIIQPGMLVVLESTTYPGTTDEILIPRLTAKGLTVGEDIFVAFSPERIDPGNEKWTVRNTPKVVGGATEACQAASCAYYGMAIQTVIPVTGTATAEMVKLLENSFRMVNIGFINEMAIMCEMLGIDVWEVIRAASSKPFGFMPFYPGPGLGGHCIPLDPLYLTWKMRGMGYNARIIETSDSVNSAMPEHVVHLVADALNEDEKSIRGSKIAILGVAYKKDIDDMRESPALHVISHLVKRGARVEYADPHVPDFNDEEGHKMVATALTAEWLESADCVVITTNHSAFDYGFIAQHSKVIVDSRNALKDTRLDASTARVVKL